MIAFEGRQATRLILSNQNCLNPQALYAERDIQALSVCEESTLYSIMIVGVNCLGDNEVRRDLTHMVGQEMGVPFST